jgi:N-acetylneuraminate synthase
MVDRTRELEHALGDADKRVVENEKETVIVQRRCLRASQDLKEGTILDRNLIDVLRPAPADAIFPYEIEDVLGLCLQVDVPAGEYFRWGMLQGMAE